MLTRTIAEETQAAPQPEDEEEFQVEQEDNSSEEKPVKRSKAELQQVGALISVINVFMVKYMPRLREEYELEKVPLFNSGNMAKLIELFFNWLTNKKYLAHKVRINQQYTYA